MAKDQYIPESEAREILVDLVRSGHAKVKLETECPHCGCSPATASDREHLRKLMLDSGIVAVKPAERNPSLGPRPAAPFQNGEKKIG